jgi:CheY-like chemotaxis protein
MLQRSADLFGPGLHEKGLEFVVDLAPELPARLFGDPQRLAQVLDTLLGNAVKFTARGHVRLAVREVPAADRQKCVLRFSVHDSGIGIDAARCAELFTAHTGADHSMTHHRGGSGPGLAVCKRLVELMGGRIGVESRPGQGSDFWFTIALQRVGAAAVGTGAPAEVAGLRVLLVDEGSAGGRVIEAQLRAWQVSFARTGDALGAAHQIELARRSGPPYDLVLLNWQPWDVDGLREMMRRHATKDAATRIPVIAIQTDSGREAKNRAVGCAQLDAVLVKPVLAAPLLGVLRLALARRAAPA